MNPFTAITAEFTKLACCTPSGHFILQYYHLHSENASLTWGVNSKAESTNICKIIMERIIIPYNLV